MRATGDKKATTLRLSVSTKDMLQNVAAKLSRSESDLVEIALLEYFRSHGLDTHYILQVHNTHLVLIKMEGGKPEVVDILHSNGVPLSAIHQELVAKHHTAVSIEYVAGGATGDH